LRQRTRTSAEASDKELAEARERLNELIPDPIDFDDTVALARLDTHIEFLQEERRRYEAILAQLLEVAAAGQRSDENRILAALDTVVPVTSRDEIGRLTASFNNMVTELRVKAQIRETFGKYVDPRIVAGLIDRPELADPGGSRREMTILFCDMQNFTGFSEEM